MAVTLNASTSSGFIQTADTSGILQVQSNGTTQFTVDSTGAYGQVERGTAVASTSGTSIDFTGLPSWVRRITVMFNGVSTNSTSNLQIQIGAGSVTTSGYTSWSATTSNATSTSSTGFNLTSSTGASDAAVGSVVITNITSNTWNYSANILRGSAGAQGIISGGFIALGGALDRVRITTVNGTDTFDAGTINILYEG